jgi:hypothetical protein
MHVAGFSDALECAVQVKLDGSLAILVVSIPALIILKLFAWLDRKLENNKDAEDIFTILRQYADAGNEDRPYGERVSILEEDDFELGDTMQISGVPFAVTDWSQVERIEHKGESGMAYWRTREFGGIRVRMVEYTPKYLANHWCAKGHVLLCIEGQLETELKDGRKFTLTPGMSYQVADNAESHRSFTKNGAKLFIVD